MRVADFLELAARRHPDKEGYVFGEDRLTFRQARDYMHAVANSLLAIEGLPANAHIAILSQNDLRVTLVQFGINYAGYAWVSLHDRNSPETNADVLDFSDAEVLIFHNALDPAI